MKPDNRKCTFTPLVERTETAPDVAFTPKALKWIKAMVECHSEEVGFMGLVEEINNVYVVTEIFYPKHCLVTSATCEIAPEGETEIAQKLIDENRVDDIAKVRFWGHSHHTMGTTPSGQDDTQAVEKMNNNGTYFIRAICNKQNELSVSFFDHARQLKFENIKWVVFHDYTEMYNNVVSVINSEVDVYKKLLAIRECVRPKVNLDDNEYKEIKKEVEELKKTQLPEKVTSSWPAHSQYNNGYSHGNFHRGGIHDTGYPGIGGYQEDMFHGSEYFGPSKKNEKNDSQPLLTDQEINSVVNGCWD